MGYPASMDTSTTQLLYLRLREHCRRGDRKIVKSLRTMKSEIVSLKNDREASSMTASTVGLPNQDWTRTLSLAMITRREELRMRIIETLSSRDELLKDVYMEGVGGWIGKGENDDYYFN